MYKLVDVKCNYCNVLDTDDGVVEKLSLDRVCSIITDLGLQIDGIVVSNGEVIFSDYNIKFRKQLRGSKFRLYPTDEQKIMLSKIFGCCRFIYNKMLAERIDYYNMYGESLINHYNDYYDGNEFLREVPARSLQMSERNLDKAYKNFYRRVKNGDSKAGFPKFKKKVGRQSYQAYNDNNCIEFNESCIRLPKVGLVKVKQHRDIQGRIMTVTVSKTVTDRYYISMNTEEWIKGKVVGDNVVGIDLGIKDLAILDDGTKFENPEILDKYLNRLRFLQQTLQRTQRGSNRRKKLQLKIARVHEKITNIRTDNIHKFTRKIVDENQVIITEDLNIKGMMSNKTHKKSKRVRGRHIANASWGEIIRQLSYKSDWYGNTYQKVGRMYPSTQLCHVCGYQNKQLRHNTNIRSWLCTMCNSYHDRDVNAAINIRDEGKRLLNIV